MIFPAVPVYWRATPERTDGVLRTAGCANYPAAPTTSIGGTAQVGNAASINELNNRVVGYATTHFADVYAQTEVRTDVGRLRVYRKPSPRFDAWILRDFAEDCVEVADARAADREMSAWKDRVSGEHQYWTNRGIDVNSVGGNPVDGVVEVGVGKAGLAKARAEIPRRYPDLRIRVVEAGSLTW